MADTCVPELCIAGFGSIGANGKSTRCELTQSPVHSAEGIIIVFAHCTVWSSVGTFLLAGTVHSARRCTIGHSMSVSALHINSNGYETTLEHSAHLSSSTARVFTWLTRLHVTGL